MSNFPRAIKIIRKYEGFLEKALADPDTNDEPYTLGYGTQFYPDGYPVCKGQMCTKEKAIEYLEKEVDLISKELELQNLNLDLEMHEALISFIHSVGWDSFLYSNILDLCDEEYWFESAKEITRWVFDNERHVIENLVNRRKEETDLFLTNQNVEGIKAGNILLKAFKDYTASQHEIEAISKLEAVLNPCILAAFDNDFNDNRNCYNYYYLPDESRLYTSENLFDK